MRFFASACSLLVCVSFMARAEAAPAQLLGKSVIVSWTEDRMQRFGGAGEFVERSVSHRLSAYISNEGRVFARRVVTATGKKGHSRSGDVSSIGSEGQNGRRQKATITGRSMVVTNQFGGGVRLARVEFGPDFSSCTAHIILGRENREGVARGHSAINGRRVDIKEAHVRNTTCSVQQGNVFGQ